MYPGLVEVTGLRSLILGFPKDVASPGGHERNVPTGRPGKTTVLVVAALSGRGTMGWRRSSQDGTLWMIFFASEDRGWSGHRLLILTRVRSRTRAGPAPRSMLGRNR